MRPEKQLLLDEIQGQIQPSGSFILLSILALNANQATEFRKTMADSGGSVEMARKRLVIIAAKNLGIDLDRKMLQGQIGLVIPKADPLSITKVLYQYTKDNEGVFSILGGRLEGKMCSSSEVQMLAELPNLDGMRASILGLFEAPMSGLLQVMDALMSSVPRCLDNKSKLGS